MIALVLAMLLSVSGADLDQAARAYGAGEYAAALKIYAKALAAPGAPQGALLYDMGNCAYRMGRFAEAALYYRSARLRLPRDEEVAFNLSLAEGRLGIDLPEERSFIAAISSLAGAFTAGELLLAAALLQAAGIAGWLLFSRTRAVRLLALFALLAGLAFAGRLVQVQWFPGPPGGVVLAREAKIRSEPHEEQPVLFKLRAGEPVRLEQSSDRWVRISHSNGTGWTERAAVGKLY